MTDLLTEEILNLILNAIMTGGVIGLFVGIVWYLISLFK